MVLDPRGCLPASARVWAPVAGQPAYRAVNGDPAPLRGVEDLRLPPEGSGCSLRHLLHELAARGASRLLVEGGGTLAEAFLAQGLVDEYHRFQADQPAGGTPVEDSRTQDWQIQARAAWEHGTWEVRRPG